MANSVNGITHPFWEKLGSIPMGHTKKNKLCVCGGRRPTNTKNICNDYV